MMSVLVVPAGFASIACVTLQKLHTRGHQAGLNLRGQYPITGVDLTRIDDIDGQTAQTISAQSVNSAKTAFELPESWLSGRS
jgi:hypothetical protein